MSAESHKKLPYDFVVCDSRGRLFALVEAKRRLVTNPIWARDWHETVVKHMTRPTDANVVLFALDHVYVWRPGATESASPDWTYEVGPWLAPYFARLRIAAKDVDPRVFEQIVGLWLQDVVRGAPPVSGDHGTAEPLVDGLRGGEVVQQAAA